METSSEQIKIFAGSSNKELAEKIVQHLDMKLTSVQLIKLADVDIFIKPNESV